MSNTRRQIRKLNRESIRDKKRNELRRRNFAIIFFVAALVFCAGEILAIFTAKNQHDYRLAKESAEELSVELSLISSAFRSGNKTLYDNSISRYQDTLASFSENDYVRVHQLELLSKLRDYNKNLQENTTSIAELLELDAALESLLLELDDVDTEKLNSMNFYQIQQSFQTLSDALANLKTEEYEELRNRIDSFARKISELAKNSAICVSVCTKESFVEMQKKLEKYRKDYNEDFTQLGRSISEKYDPSSLILELGKL